MKESERGNVAGHCSLTSSTSFLRYGSLQGIGSSYVGLSCVTENNCKLFYVAGLYNQHTLCVVIRFRAVYALGGYIKGNRACAI